MHRGGVSHREERYVVYSETLCVLCLLIATIDDRNWP